MSDRAQHLDNMKDAFEEWWGIQNTYPHVAKESIRPAFYDGYRAGEAKGDTNGEG